MSTAILCFVLFFVGVGLLVKELKINADVKKRGMVFHGRWLHCNGCEELWECCSCGDQWIDGKNARESHGYFQSACDY